MTTAGQARPEPNADTATRPYCGPFVYAAAVSDLTTCGGASGTRVRPSKCGSASSLSYRVPRADDTGDTPEADGRCPPTTQQPPSLGSTGLCSPQCLWGLFFFSMTQFARLWHWGLVRNIWRGGPNELHQSVRILLHFTQFCIRRQVCTLPMDHGESNSTPGARRASFFDHYPSVPVFAPTSPNNLEYFLAVSTNLAHALHPVHDNGKGGGWKWWE